MKWSPNPGRFSTGRCSLLSDNVHSVYYFDNALQGILRTYLKVFWIIDPKILFQRFHKENFPLIAKTNRKGVLSDTSLEVLDRGILIRLS